MTAAGRNAGRAACAGSAAPEAAQRGALYGLLAAVFAAEPTTEFLDHLRAPAMAEALADAGVDLGRALDETGAEATALAVEYARLFIGPGPHIAPYSSTHVGGRRTLWGASTQVAQACFADAGFTPAPELRNPPDHISNALHFMQALAEAEADAPDAAARQQYAAVQRNFLDTHLTLWAPAFFDAVAARAEYPYFREFAGLAKRFLAGEAASAPQASAP